MRNLLIIAFISILLLSCNNGFDKKKISKIEKQNSIYDRNIVVEFNKNIETIGIILDLSEMGDYIINRTGKDYTFAHLYRKEFREFKNHVAVQKVNELGRLNLLHFGHYYYGITFSQLPDFEVEYPRYPDLYVSKTLSYDSLDRHLNEFDSLVRLFYRDAQVEQFLDKTKNIQQWIYKEISSTIPNKILSSLEAFHGIIGNDYVIVPSATIFTGFNFGPNIQKEGKKVFYYVTGPAYDVDTNINDFNMLKENDSLGFNDKEYIAEMAIHEFSHSFVRFLDNENIQKIIDSLSYLNTDELIENLQQIGEGTSWSTCFEEHLVRACEIMIWRRLGNNKIAKQKLKYEREVEGLLYIEEFVGSLEKYEESRDKYKMLKDYINILINDISNIDTN